MNDLKVIDTEFNLLAAIDTYQSIGLSRKLSEVGDIEIHSNYFAPGAQCLRENNIVFLDPKRPYLVVSREIEETTSGVLITARGKQLKGILGQRITLPGVISDTEYYGFDRFPGSTDPDAPAETVMKYYVNKHAVTPADINRKITELVIATDQGRGLAMRWSSRFEALDSCLKGICEYAEMGYDISLDLVNKRFVFDIVPGTDHSASGSAPVIFSVAFSNVDSTKYAIDQKEAVSVAYAGGAGENENRLIQAVFANGVSSGLSRREAWIDCGSVGTVQDLVYEAQHRMQDSTEVETLSGDISTSELLGYGEKWDLGDIVTIQSVSLGISRDAKITEVRESYENGKRDINVTFGKRQKSILDEIRKTEVIR